MVSNPTFDPNPWSARRCQAEQLAYFSYTQKDHEGFFPLRPIANRRDLPSRVDHEGGDEHRRLQPQAVAWPASTTRCSSARSSRTRTSRCATRSGPCGGDDDPDAPLLLRPGLRRARRAAGRAHHDQAGRAVRLQLGARRSTCPRPRSRSSRRWRPNSQAFLGQSSIGQYDVQTTALQNAMVAAGIANGGVLMTPHLMSSIHDSQGSSWRRTRRRRSRRWPPRRRRSR